MRILSFVPALLALAAGSVAAQQTTPPAPPTLALSGVATTEVRILSRSIGGKWMAQAAGMAGPSRIAISYGQTHARGRTIMGGVVPYGAVWRLGANLATTLHTDVNLTLGGTQIPRGEYSLFALPTQTGWQLIVNKQVNQWGTDYDPKQDLARIPLRVSTRSEPLESLSIYLVPSGDRTGDPHGVLTIIWEKTELSADWQAGI